MLPRIAVLLAALLAAAACSSEGTSPDCKEVCRKEAACVDQVVVDDDKDDEEQNRFDQSECIAACDALSRDEVGKKLVEKHTECALKAGKDCAALLLCK